MNKKVTVIDSGSGNLLSIKRAFENWDVIVDVASEKEKILSASRLVLPGVGAFKNAVENLKLLNFFDLVEEIKLKNIPTLGVCLGMQLLFEESEEFGKFKGLGLMEGKVQKLPNLSTDKKKLKIPNIGWHNLVLSQTHSSFKNGDFFKNFKTNDSFYFVHSYFVNPTKKDLILASYNFGGHLIPSIVGKDNFIGCQFHPEKSGNSGLNLIKNFISI